MKANGYCRSEGIVVVFLQKKSNCKRLYLKVLEVLDSCDGYKEEGQQHLNDTTAYYFHIFI